MTQCNNFANDVDTSVLCIEQSLCTEKFLCTEKSSCMEQSTNKINLILIFEANITHATKDKNSSADIFKHALKLYYFMEYMMHLEYFFDLVVFFSIQNKFDILDSPNRSNVSENEKKPQLVSNKAEKC